MSKTDFIRRLEQTVHPIAAKQVFARLQPVFAGDIMAAKWTLHIVTEHQVSEWFGIANAIVDKAR